MTEQIKIEHTLGDYVSNDRPYKCLDVVRLDGESITYRHTVHLSREVADIITEGLKTHYTRDFFELVREKLLDLPITIAFGLRSTWSAKNRLVVYPYCGKPPTGVVPLIDRYAVRDTTVESYIILRHNYRGSYKFDELVEKITKLKMRTDFVSCFRNGKSLVPEGMDWEAFQKSKSKLENLPHSKQLARTAYKNNQSLFHHIFNRMANQLPSVGQEPYATHRVRYGVLATKADVKWQANTILRTLDKKKIATLTIPEMNELCKEYFRDRVKRMGEYLETATIDDTKWDRKWL